MNEYEFSFINEWMDNFSNSSSSSISPQINTLTQKLDYLWKLFCSPEKEVIDGAREISRRFVLTALAEVGGSFFSTHRWKLSVTPGLRIQCPLLNSQGTFVLMPHMNSETHICTENKVNTSLFYKTSRHLMNECFLRGCRPTFKIRTNRTFVIVSPDIRFCLQRCSLLFSKLLTFTICSEYKLSQTVSNTFSQISQHRQELSSLTVVRVF